MKKNIYYSGSSCRNKCWDFKAVVQIDVYWKLYGIYSLLAFNHVAFLFYNSADTVFGLHCTYSCCLCNCGVA